MNKYTEMQHNQQNEINSFPCFFAFSDSQFNEGMQKLGLEPTDTGKVYRGPAGMIYRKTDAAALAEMLDRHDRERREAIEGDTTGEGYIYDMFLCEMGNHEYGYTGDPEDTLDACGLTWEEVTADPRLLKGWKKAEKRIFAEEW